MKQIVLLLAVATIALTSAPARGDAPLVSITGTVVSIEGEVLTLRTDQGNLMFDIDKTTEMPANVADFSSIPVNSRITVWYDSDDKPEDRMDARKIAMAPASSMGAAAPRSPSETESRSQYGTESRSQMSTESRTDVSRETRSDASRFDADDQERELPATAGPIPLIAGAGLLALAGGAFLKRRSRRS